MVTIDIPESVYWGEAPDLRLHGEQSRFASPSLAEWLRETESSRDRGDVLPFLVREDGRPVGFFALAAGESELGPYGREGKDVVLLRNFFVVPEAQGKGIASRMLDAVPAVVRRYFPACRSVALVVNFKNAAAKRLYAKHGWVDSGDVWPGREGGPAHVYDRKLS